MSKVFKRLIVIGIIVAVLFGAFMFVWFNHYVLDIHEAFRITLEVDKTQARVGDTVTVTARLENVSGRHLRIRTGSPSIRRIDDMLMVLCVPKDLDFRFMGDDLGGLHFHRTFRRGTVIEQQITVVIEESTDYIASAAAAFRLRGGSHRTFIFAESIIITIKGEV